MEERKGIFTPEQENQLDDLIVLNNGVAESLDGIGISLIDNKGLQVLKEKAEEKYPGVTDEFIYPIVDAIMEGLAQLTKE